MRRWAISVISFCGLIFSPHFVFASVVINEILFDPAGTDTGLEKIELYNPDSAAQDLSNFEFYPDGIGYFVFPAGFSLGSKSFLTIHLRVSGADDAQNLYHSSAISNMGNSSGSAALFRFGGRSKDTIVDFARYHKPGASERKTWESAAVEAGLWSTGEFVDISSLTEGNSIGLFNDGIRVNAASWKIYSSPSIGAANAETAPPSPPAATSTPPADAGRAPMPALGADAGKDITAITGAIVEFRGLAFGLDAKPLDNARFLWNFGDGSIKEGKSLTHVYYFPGVYRANLLVSSGEYTGSAWRMVTVIPAQIRISEVKPGSGGFIELFSASEETVDLGGMNLRDEKKNIFQIPVGTLVGGNSAIVFANAITGLDPAMSLLLRDARVSVLDEAEFSSQLPFGASWQRSGEKFIVATTPTPGKFNPQSSQQKIISAPPSALQTPTTLSNQVTSYSSETEKIATTSRQPPQEAPGGENAALQDKPRALASIFGANIFLTASIVLGLVVAAGFIIAKRMLS